MGVGQTPLCLWALSVCFVTQPPRPLPRPWPQASSVSAPTSWALSSPHAPALWSLCPCLGRRAGGTEAGQGLSPVTHHGARRWGQDDSGLATSPGLSPVYPDAGTSHCSGPEAPSTVLPRALSPIVSLTPRLVLSSFLPISIPSPLHFLAVEPLASFTLSGPQFFHLQNGLVIVDLFDA